MSKIPRVITVGPMTPEKSAYALARYSRSPDSIRDSIEWVRTHDSTRFLESFDGGGLSVGQSRFGAALRKRPAAAAAGLNEKEFDRAPAKPVANRRDLFAIAHLAQLRHSNGLTWSRDGVNCRADPSRPRNLRLPHSGTHRYRVHEDEQFWLEPSLVLAYVES